MDSFDEKIISIYEAQIENLEKDITNIKASIKEQKSQLKNPVKSSLKFILIANFILEFILLVPNKAITHINFTILTQLIETYVGLTIFTVVPSVVAALSAMNKNKAINLKIENLKTNKKEVLNKIDETKKLIDEVYDKCNDENLIETKYEPEVESENIDDLVTTLHGSKNKTRTLKK